MLADNKLALNADWDPDLLAQELQDLSNIDFDLDLIGFSLAEIDLVLDEAREASPDTRDAPEDALPDRSDAVVTQRGDLWKLGEHYLLCGDAREPADFARLMHGRKADLVFTDPPYNVRIDGNVWENAGISSIGAGPVRNCVARWMAILGDETGGSAQPVSGSAHDAMDG